MSSAKIWSHLSSVRKSDGAVLKFRFQEATANEKDEVIDFKRKYSSPAENFNKGAGISKSKEATEEWMGFFDLIYKECHTIICYEENQSNNFIIALSMISLERENDEDLLANLLSVVKTPEVKKMVNIFQVTDELCDGRKQLGLDKYYSDRGLCVHPAYTGLGIATELFRLRRVVSKEHGVPATGAWMTAIGSQKAAERDGWKTLFEIPFDELGRLTGCDFTDAPPTCKMMVALTDVK